MQYEPIRSNISQYVVKVLNTDFLYCICICMDYARIEKFNTDQYILLIDDNTNQYTQIQINTSKYVVKVLNTDFLYCICISLYCARIEQFNTDQYILLIDDNTNQFKPIQTNTSEYVVKVLNTNISY